MIFIIIPPIQEEKDVNECVSEHEISVRRKGIAAV